MPHCSFSKSGEHRHLHSFPTRRSSDLIANLIRGLAPEAVIVGGPIVRSWPIIADDIKNSVEATICRGLPSTQIIASTLGPEPTLMGALSLVLASKFASVSVV